MIVLRKDQQRRPFGGHHYPEMGMVVRAEKFEDLVEKVGELRIRNNHPIGRPEEEILRYYAEHYPFMVSYAGQDQKLLEEPMKYKRWRQWVQTIWRHPPKRLVTPKEASFRWEVCEKCPKNVRMDWAESDESAEITRRSFMLRAGQDSPEYLGYCSCHRADLASFSFINEPVSFSAKEKGGGQPEACWVK